MGLDGGRTMLVRAMPANEDGEVVERGGDRQDRHRRANGYSTPFKPDVDSSEGRNLTVNHQTRTDERNNFQSINFVATAGTEAMLNLPKMTDVDCVSIRRHQTAVLTFDSQTTPNTEDT